MTQPINQTTEQPPLDPCRKCGQTHDPRKCTGHVDNPETGTIRPCKRGPTRGLKVCNSHGARAPQSKRAAARRLEAAAVERAAATYGVAREVNPIQAMVELLHDAAGAVAWLREIIRASEPDALIWGVADEVNKGSGEFPGVDTRHAAAPSVWLARYDVERRLMLDVSRELAKLGIEWEAREAIRKQGAVLAKVAREMARRLGHDPGEPVVAEAFRAALRDALGVGADVDRVLEGRLV